jgi:hypothetical protein
MRYLLLTLVLFLLSGLAHAQPRLVARTDASAPGISGVFSGFNAPVIIGGGSVAFGASVNDGNFNFTSGLWSEGDGIGALRAVALEGDTAPTVGSLAFTGFYDPERSYVFNDLGDVAFLGELTGGIHAIYTDRERLVGPALLEIARVGQPAVDTDAGRNYNGLDLLSMAHIHSGVAFKAQLTPGAAPNDFPSDSIYNESFAVVLGNVAEVADPAPGTSRPIPLGTALFTEFHAPTINDAGHIAFSATTNAGSSPGSIGGEGIWSTSPAGMLRAVALAGQSAPGAPSTFSIIFGRNLQYDSVPVINDDGDVAFQATLNGLIAGNLRVGTWVERDGVVEKVAYESESAPGTSSTFQRLDEPLIDSAGLSAFTAEVADGKDGIWRETAPGVLTMLALQGEPAPGTAFNYQNISELALNRTGDLAFLTQLSNFGKVALYETDSSGVVRKVVATDDVIDLEGSPFRVDEVFFQGLTGSISGTGGGLGSGLNDQGQLAAIVRGEILDGEQMPTGEYLDALVVFEPPGDCELGDFDCDGDFDGRDFLAWQRNPSVGDLSDWQANYGVGMLNANSVVLPEPSALGLLFCGVLAGLFRRSGST